MNKKILCAALLAGLGVAHAASAQTFDDRWYVSGSVGINHQDSDRNTTDTPFATLGFGRFLTPNWSLEAELNYQNPDKKENNALWWSQYGVSADARYHFRTLDSKWWPYIRAGIGWQQRSALRMLPCPRSGLFLIGRQHGRCRRPAKAPDQLVLQFDDCLGFRHGQRLHLGRHGAGTARAGSRLGIECRHGIVERTQQARQVAPGKRFTAALRHRSHRLALEIDEMDIALSDEDLAEVQVTMYPYAQGPFRQPRHALDLGIQCVARREQLLQ